ncbi:hypothetical protein Tco_0743909, partial [Tanacetum coccineum]
RQSRKQGHCFKRKYESSTPAVSSDVAWLKYMSSIALDKRIIPKLPRRKAVEQSCVTCGGGHSYQNCPATDGNIYRDNIQEYVSQAAAVNYNQGNASYRPQMVANQIRPPGFPPMQTNQNNQNRGINFNQNRGNNFNQNRGNNFNQGQVYQPQINQPPTFQAPPYHAPVPPAPGVSKPDFDNYVKANDAVMQNMQNQMANITDLITKFVNSNTASTYGRVLFSNPLLTERVLEISKMWQSHSTSDSYDRILASSFTPFGGSDFLMEEIDAFLEHDDSIPPGVDGIYDSEGDTVYLEELLSVINSDPNLPPSPVCEINVPEEIKSSYEDKTALIKVLKSHKHAIAWKISDIKGIDPQFCTHKILMEENAKPVVQHQRRVNPKIHEVIKQEVIKLLDAGLIYPISDSPWMLERLAGNETMLFGRLLRLLSNPNDPLIKREDYFTCPYETICYRRCLLVYAMHRARSKGILVDISEVDVLQNYLIHYVKGNSSFLVTPDSTDDLFRIFPIRPAMTHTSEKETPFILSRGMHRSHLKPLAEVDTCSNSSCSRLGLAL